MKVIIDIPQDHKRVIDNLVSDGKEYLLPQEVETRLARSVKIGTVIPDNATNGEVIMAMFPDAKIEGIEGLEGLQCVAVSIGLGTSYFALDLWNAPYMKGVKE